MRISDWGSDVCSSDRFSQRGGVDVCVYRDRSVKRLPQCLDEIAACPSGLCRFELLAEAWIRGIENKRSECRDADGAYLASVWQLRRCPVDDRSMCSFGGRRRPAILRQHSIFRRQRSEEHTSELQSLMRLSYAVFCLKKKNTNT